MITKFGSLFAGNVDLDQIGLEGTPANDRWLSDEHLVTVFDKCQAMVQLMDRVGDVTGWAAEHDFEREGYECIPNLLMLFVHLAHLTTRIKFGSGFNIAPMWHPLRLAEDFATADILTGGRVIFGVGRGYHTREVETFGAPLRDQPANRDLFEEQVEVIFKAFNNPSFSHQGTYYTIPPHVPYRGYELQELTLVPQPIHRPIECWQPIQSATPRGLDFMAKHGIKGAIGGGVAEGGAMHSVMEGYREALRRVGRDVQLGEDLAIGFHFRLAKTQEEGIKAAAKHYEENLKMVGPVRLVRSLSEAQIEAMCDPRRGPSAGLPTLEEAVKKGAFLCGPPELMIEQLMRLEERYPGLERITVSHPVSTPHAAMLEQWEWFATDVMPAFKKRVQEPVPAN